MGCLAGLPTIRLGILPLTSQLPATPLHGFWILDDRVLIETHHSEDDTNDPADLALYHRLADTLWTSGAEDNTVPAPSSPKPLPTTPTISDDQHRATSEPPCPGLLGRFAPVASCFRAAPPSEGPAQCPVPLRVIRGKSCSVG